MDRIRLPTKASHVCKDREREKRKEGKEREKMYEKNLLRELAQYGIRGATRTLYEA